jgi:hypothetical protein
VAIFINGYWWLFLLMPTGGYWWLFLLIGIVGYFY